MRSQPKPPSQNGFPKLRLIGALVMGILLVGTLLTAAIVMTSKGGTKVTITPASSYLPANFLKFYLQFDAPVTRGDVFQHLSLFETDGNGTVVTEVTEPFREVELWDETFTRLTLWLHPGRQKPGVNLNVEIGPVLEPNKSYVLKISPEWLDEKGKPIAEDVEKSFETTDPKNGQLKPEAWSVTADKEHAVITIPNQIDPISLHKYFKVSGDPPSELTVESTNLGTSKITITPSNGFETGDYEITLDPRLEDLSGNSVAQPFNVDLEKNPNFKARTEPAVLKFSVK